VILAHRKELLDQITATLDDFNVRSAQIAPGTVYDPRYPVHVASVMSVVRKLSQVQVPDYVIIDEAHHAIPGSTWNKTLDFWRKANSKLRIIGVTATPERLSGEGLDHTFDQMIMGPSVAKLIEDKFLAPYKMFAPPRAIDTSQLHHRAGDFARKEAEELMSQSFIMGDAIAHYKKHLNGAPCVGFCVSIAHAEAVAANYAANGFQAVHISGKTKKSERNEIIRDFSQGRINYLASCDLISEGLDVPGMMGCQNLRPTESLALCLQQWGRTLRYVKGKTAIILDHVGNSSRHGLPDQDREWSLKGRDKKKGETDGDGLVVKQCKACGRMCAAACLECPECGEEFDVEIRSIKEIEGELEEIKEQEKWQFRKSRFAAKDLDSLTAVGRLRGMKNPEGWAKHVLDARTNKRRRYG